MNGNTIAVTLPSAGRQHSLHIPDNGRVTIAATPEFFSLPDPQLLIRQALDNPIGSPRIERMVKPSSRVCIICDDMTRPTPTALILQDLLPRLLGAGVSKDNIFFVLALGSHRPMTHSEMEDKLGRDIVAQYRVFNSEFNDPAQLTQVGVSQLGTPIRVFKTAMEADFRIAIGNIVPHGCMGWSGGAKILYPGITSADIVSEFHVMQGFQEDLVYGMDECPIRLAVEEWSKKIGLHFIINTSLTGSLQLYRVVAGDYVKAHRAGVVYSRQTMGVPIAERPDIVVVSSFPTDQDLWQCTKGVYGGGRVIANGGTMLLLAPCIEGVGPHASYPANLGIDNGMQQLQARIDARETGEELLSLAVGVSVGKLRRRCTIHLLTDGCTQQEVAPSGFHWHPEADLQAVFDKVYAQYKDPAVLVIPFGGETLPYLT